MKTLKTGMIKHWKNKSIEELFKFHVECEEEWQEEKNILNDELRRAKIIYRNCHDIIDEYTHVSSKTQKLYRNLVIDGDMGKFLQGINEPISKSFFKYTNAGLPAWVYKDSFALMAYAEGSDIDFPECKLYFPFSQLDLDNLIGELEGESKHEWNIANKEESFL